MPAMSYSINACADWKSLSFSQQTNLRVVQFFRAALWQPSRFNRVARKKREEETLWDKRMQLMLTINHFCLWDIKPSTSIRIVLCKIVYFSFKECYSWLVSSHARPANTSCLVNTTNDSSGVLSPQVNLNHRKT